MPDREKTAAPMYLLAHPAQVRERFMGELASSTEDPVYKTARYKLRPRG